MRTERDRPRLMYVAIYVLADIADVLCQTATTLFRNVLPNKHECKTLSNLPSKDHLEIMV
jgi:hypothetical protein